MPFFSVIIPLYNKQDYIEHTLQSVLNQSFVDFEVILVDDCSTDKGLTVVQKLKNDRIRIIEHEQNKGLSTSRNTGIRNAKSNYIAFLDADDVWDSQYLSELYYLITNYPEAHLYATSYLEIYPNNITIAPKINWNNFDKNDGITSNFFECNLNQPIYCPSGLCVKKDVFETIGYYNEQITFGEDVDFNIRANSSFKLAFSKKHLVNYTMYSQNQITQTSLKNKVITDFDSYETLAKNNLSLKKYLDFNRYIMAKHYKMERNWENFKKMKKGINRANLNSKQLFLLNSPLFLLQIIKRIKVIFVKKGIRFTSYD